MKKRLISMILALCVVVSLLPTAVFAALSNSRADTQTAVRDYADVKKGDWCYDAVQYVNQNSLFNGTGNNKFSPDGTMTRGMYVTVMGRMVQVDTAKYSKAPEFTDLAPGAYYTPYVAWAVEKSITTGVGERKFDPDGLVTRQQMAAFTVRFFEAYGYALPKATVTTTPKDIDSVSAYAKQAVMKLWACGLLAGDTTGNVNPGSYAIRSQAATFVMRVDKHLIDAGYKKANEQKPDNKPDNNGAAVNYTITFETNGGAALTKKTLPSESKLLENLPTPFKLGSVFQGWYKDPELKEAVTASDTVTENMTLYAQYTTGNGVTETETTPFASAVNASSALRIKITDSTKALSVETLKSAIAYTCLSDPEFNDIMVTGGNGQFEVYGNGGWPAGSTNKLELLNDKLSFTGEDPTADVYNFTVAKEETLDLSLSTTMKYLPATSVTNMTQDGKAVYNLSVPLAKVQAASTADSAANTSGTTTGTFTYSSRTRDGQTIKVGDTVAIYEGVRPDQRTLNGDSTNYAEDEVAYVTITEVNGSNYKYKNASAEDVLFMPDVLPVSDKADEDGNSTDNAIKVKKSLLTFTDDKYAGSGLDATTTVDTGDFLAFYTGDTINQDTPVKSYAKIKTVDATDSEYYVITYDPSVSEDEVYASMDIYDDTPVSGEQILKKTDVAALESSIVEQAKDSGFVLEASQYLAALALQTDGFQNLSGDMQLKNYNISVDDGKALPTDNASLMSSKAKLENVSVTADIRTALKHFEGKSGVRAALTVSFDVVVPTGENKIVVHVEGTFEEEVRLSMNVSGGAVWKKAWIFPYIADYRMNANLDVYNFTGINVNAMVGTFGKDETPDLDKDDDWDNVAGQLRDLIDKAEEGKETIDGIDTMGTSLADKYASMMENESDWVELFSVSLFKNEGFVDLLHILCYGFNGDLVVSANMNISIGFDFYYENAKRYNFSLGLFSKTSQSDTVVLVEEKYEFTFYVMGTIGMRAGLRLEVSVGLFSLELDSIGITAEVGAYVRMWGYFYYRLTWTASAGKDSQATGALLLEVGIYLDIKFRAQAFNGLFEYNPTLYENEWPLWSAGSVENVQSFSYSAADAPSVEMKKTNYSAVLPDSAFSMSVMNLKDGSVTDQVFDDSEDNYTIKMTNPAFSYDRATNTVTVVPGKEVEQVGSMVITWKNQPLTFSSKSISSTIPLSWEDPTGAFTITFQTMGGSSVKPVMARPGIAIAKPADPVKTGYVFGGWYTDKSYSTEYVFPEKMGDSDTVVYAKWNPATDTKYSVEHYQQSLTNDKQYTLTDTDNFTNGVTDSVIQPETKTYEGFTAPAKKELEIKPDGSAVLKYYYTRNTYKLTFSRGEQSESTTDADATVYRLKYGAAMNAPKMASGGYIFTEWTPEWKDMDESGKPVTHTMPGHDVTYTALWKADPNTPYRVEHYVQNANDDGYSLSSVESLKGETGTSLTIADLAKPNDQVTYDHGAANNQDVKIAKDGSLVIKLYYNRKSFPVNFHVKDGGTTTTSYRHGATIVAPESPTKQGFDFSGWYSDEALSQAFTFGGAMPGNAIDLYGQFTPSKTTAFTVEHYVQDVNGTYTYNKTSQNTKGETGATLTLADYKDASLEVPGGISYDYAQVGGNTVTSANISADGKLVIKLYYTRQSHTLTFDPANGGKSTTVTGLYDSAVTAPKVTKTGYDFEGWSPVAPAKMPAADASYTAQWTESKNTAYKVEYWQQNANDNEYTKLEETSLTGTTGATVNAVEKEYTNFTLNKAAAGTVASGKITADGSLVLKLYYDRNTVTVNFDPNGGTLGSSGESKTFKYGQKFSADNPTRANYSFDGWYKGEIKFTQSSTVTENLTLTAKWTAGQVNYTVEHYVMGTDGTYPTAATATATPSGTVGTSVTLAELKDSTHEVTNGIEYVSAEIGGKTETSATVAAGMTVKLYYQRVQHTLSWNANGGTLNSDGTPAGQVYYGAALKAPTGTKTGFKLTGFDPAVLATMPAADAAYTAQWTAQVFNITYRDQGDSEYSGSGTLTPASYTVGTAVTLPTPAADAKTGYTFGGWFDNAACTGTAVTGIPADATGAKTFYAKWTANEYNITYTLNDGTNDSENPAKYTYGTALTLKNPTRTGYAFDGWYLESGFTNKVTQIAATDIGAKTLFAKWSPVTYTVKFNPGDGTTGTMDDQTLTYDKSANLTANSFEKAGYSFAGWATVSGGGKVYDDSASVKNLANTQDAIVTLYALWTKTSYTITYHMNGVGTNPAENPTTYDGTKEIKLAEPTLDGYSFDGWYTTADFAEGTKIEANTAAIAVGASGAKDFYAKWSQVAIEIGTAERLEELVKAMNENPEKAKLLYRLTADITFGTGSSITSFTGTFDGAGHTITGLTAPLFNEVGATGLVENLNIVSAIDRKNAKSIVYMGLITGKLTGGTIQDCTVGGDVSNYDNVHYVGGAVGLNNGGKLTNVTSTMQYSYVRPGNSLYSKSFGCLIGEDNGGTITNCNASGSALYVNNTDFNGWTQDGIGGLVGVGINSTIRNSVGGTISSVNNSDSSGSKINNFGGIIGRASGNLTIDGCNATTAIRICNSYTSDSYIAAYAGGLVGSLSNQVGETAVIRNCYTSANLITANDYAGGLIGGIDAAGTVTIENCVANGEAKTLTKGNTYEEDKNRGGLIADVKGSGTVTVRNCVNNAASTLTSISPYMLVGTAGSTKLTVENCYWLNGTKSAFKTWSGGNPTGCGTYENTSANVEAGTATNCLTEQTLTYSGTITNVLNGWVSAQGGKDFRTWETSGTMLQTVKPAE